MTDKIVLSTAVGVGDSVAADDLGASIGKAQWVKLMDGTDGGTDVIPGTAASGLRVDPGPVSVADGGTLPAKGVQIGGTDGSVFQVMSTDNAGRPNVNINGTVPVSGPLTDTQLRASVVPVDTELPAAAALADGAANATTPTVGAAGLLWNGTTWDRAKGDATNGAFVNVKAMIALPAGSNEIGGVNVTKLAGTAVSVSSGNKDAGTQRVTLATDQVQPTNPFKVDGSAVTQPVSAAVGSPVFTTVTPSTTGGWSKITALAQTTTKKAVKASAGTFGGYYAYNPNASVAYIQVFDLASGSVTLGTTAPDLAFGIPPASAANLEITNGVNMAAAITLACTTTATGSTAPATGLDLTLLFK